MYLSLENNQKIYRSKELTISDTEPDSSNFWQELDVNANLKYPFFWIKENGVWVSPIMVNSLSFEGIGYKYFIYAHNTRLIEYQLILPFTDADQLTIYSITNQNANILYFLDGNEAHISETINFNIDKNKLYIANLKQNNNNNSQASYGGILLKFKTYRSDNQ